jgi:hypothetical protein
LTRLRATSPTRSATREWRRSTFGKWNEAAQGTGAVLTGREDRGDAPAITQRIPITDFPLESVKLYVEGGVLLLPSEH